MKKYCLPLLFLVFIVSHIHGQNVGIGTTSPNARLHIKGGADTSQLVIDANHTQSNEKPLIRLRNADGNDVLHIHSDAPFNTFVGLGAGRSNTLTVSAGLYNTFIGSSAGYYNTLGAGNTALGRSALFQNTIGGANTTVGYKSLFSNTEGGGNTSVGYEALVANITGAQNTAAGAYSLSFNTSGILNTANGAFSLYSNTKGLYNVGIGAYSLKSNTTASRNTALGFAALETQSFSNSGNIWETNNVAVGYEALFSNNPSSALNGISNTAVGAETMRNNTTGFDNTALGTAALYTNTTGRENTALGRQSLFYNTVGQWNTAAGYKSLRNNSSGIENSAFGREALLSNTTGHQNTAVGSGSLSQNLSGVRNTAVGTYALSWNLTGNDNTAFGEGSGTHSAATNLNNTISIGNYGYLNGSGNQAFLGNLSTIWNGGNRTWSTYSDARMKNNITEDVKGLEFITRLRPVTYNRSISIATTLTGNKETPDYPGKYDVEKIRESGFLAQEVEAAAKEAGYDFSGVTIPKEDIALYTLSYEQFVVPLVKAVQEQQKQIIDLKKDNDALIARLEKLERMIANK